MKFDEKTMTEVYCSLIRPVLEYCSTAYHTTLTAEQSEMLERLQRQLLKIIFGYDVSYAECILRSGIERLDNRRERLFANFTHKCYDSHRFGPKWFTPKQPTSYHLRAQAKSFNTLLIVRDYRTHQYTR